MGTDLHQALSALYEGVLGGWNARDGKVRDVRAIGDDAAILRAVAGIVAAGQSDLNPQLNSVQSMTAERRDGQWRIVHYQNTPAAYHGRPELVVALTDELRDAQGDRTGG